MSFIVGHLVISTSPTKFKNDLVKFIEDLQWYICFAHVQVGRVPWPVQRPGGGLGIKNRTGMQRCRASGKWRLYLGVLGDVGVSENVVHYIVPNSYSYCIGHH